MRKAFLLAAFLGGMAGADARQLSPTESLQRLAAAQSGPAKARQKAAGQYTLAYTSQTDQGNAFYVFNTPQSDGFVVLGADDLVPDVLGYSDSGAYDAANLPDGLRYWMECMAQDARAALISGQPVATATPRAASRKPVEPLCSSLWGQGRPFYNLTPEFDGTHAPAGCVAVSMAQVMYKHKYPSSGEGTYDYYLSSTHMSGRFGAIYDWDSMVDYYGTVYPAGGWNSQYCDYSDAARDAAARLLYDLGMSVHMNYSANGSGTDGQNAAEALVNNFKYDLGVRYNTREFFTTDEWEAMIYAELAAQRPVIYGAVNPYREGHSFVFDGYRDGLFHVNWGWNGQGNGYYVITGANALRPVLQDTGEDMLGAAYSGQHHCITGIQPMQPGSRLAVNINYYSNTAYSLSDKNGSRVTTVATGTPLHLVCSDYSPNRNMSTRDVEVTFGARFEDVATGKTYYTLHPSAEPTYLWTFFGGPADYDISTTGLPAGTYRVYYAVKTTDGNWFDVRNPSTLTAPQLTITGDPVDPIEPVDPVPPVDPVEPVDPADKPAIVLPEFEGYTVGQPITDPSQLISGTYFVSVWSKGNEGILVGNAYKNIGNVPLAANVGRTIDEAEAYWTVNVHDDGTFTLTNGNGHTISVMGEQGVGRHNVRYVDETSGADVARFTLHPTTVSIGGVTHWMVYQQNEMSGENKREGFERHAFLHCNCTDLYNVGAYGGADRLRLSFWSGSNPSLASDVSCCKLAFYPAVAHYDYEPSAATVARIIDRLPTRKNTLDELQRVLNLILHRGE